MVSRAGTILVVIPARTGARLIRILANRTMSIIYSHNVTLDSIFINNTVTSGTAGEPKSSARHDILCAYNSAADDTAT